MSITAKIKSGEGKPIFVGVRESKLYGNGIKAINYPGEVLENSAAFYVNDTYGAALNQDASVGGTPDLIHDGIDSVLWNASALSGTWTFNSTAQAHGGTRSIDGTATANNDEAIITRGSTIDLNNYVSVSGWIYITSWSTNGTKDVEILFRNGVTDVTTIVDMSTYVVTSLFNTWQQFTIPLSDLLVGASTVDVLSIRTIDIGGGQAPNYYLDDIQLDETGSTIVFEIKPDKEEVWEIDNIHFTFVSTYTGTLADATMPRIPSSGFLALSPLVSGIGVRRVQSDEITFNSVFRNMIDMIASPGEKNIISGSDGLETWVRLEIKFPNRFRLSGDGSDKIQILINDDMSGLTFFKASSNYGIVGELE